MILIQRVEALCIRILSVIFISLNLQIIKGGRAIETSGKRCKFAILKSMKRLYNVYLCIKTEFKLFNYKH